jgi:transcription initiation factor TFIID subunit 1
MIEKIKHLLKQQSNYESEAFEAVEFRNRIEQLNEEERHQLEVIKNFAKNQRQTTKMQKDQYQKELNNQL